MRKYTKLCLFIKNLLTDKRSVVLSFQSRKLVDNIIRHRDVWQTPHVTHLNLCQFYCVNSNKNVTIKTTERIGIHPDWIEAVAFAWLTQQTIHRKPANVPTVTGVRSKTILGAVYPVK